MDTFSPDRQEPELLKFARAICSADNALKRDACGDWHIAGKHGHVYAYAPSRFQFFVTAESKQAWTFAKKAFKFARLCNDGDEGGGFFLDRLPTKTEAATIRAYCGIHKRPSMSAARRNQLSKRGRDLQKTRLAA
jgi:hypothetical protein